MYRTERPRWPHASRLRAVDELVEIRCERGADADSLVCEWHSVHVYEREDPSSPAPQTVTTFELPFSGSEVVDVRFDGPFWFDDERTDELTIGDDGTAPTVVLEITVVGRWRSLEAVQGGPRCVGRTAYQRRHILLGRRGSEFISTISDRYYEWGRDPSGELTVVVDAPPRVELRKRHSWPRTRVHEPPRRTADGVRARYDVGGDVEIRVVRSPKVTGGVFLGLGAAFLDVDHHLRGRFGAEFAAPSKGNNLLYHSLAVETDFRESLTFVPAIERDREPKRFRYAPNLGFGTGVPLQIPLQNPEGVRPGLRALATASWPVVGFVVTFDWYPKFQPTQQHLLQLGLLTELRF